VFIIEHTIASRSYAHIEGGFQETYRSDSSVSVVTRLWVRRPGFDSRQEHGFFYYPTTMSRSVVGPTRLHVMSMGNGFFFPGEKATGSRS